MAVPGTEIALVETLVGDGVLTQEQAEVLMEDSGPMGIIEEMDGGALASTYGLKAAESLLQAAGMEPNLDRQIDEESAFQLLVTLFTDLDIEQVACVLKNHNLARRAAAHALHRQGEIELIMELLAP